MQSPLLWVIVAGIVISLILVALKIRSRRAHPGFVDFVKNPAIFDGFVEASQEATAIVEEAKAWDDWKVEKLTRWYVLDATTGREAWREARILRGLGQRTHAAVLSVLNNPRLYDRLVQPTGEDLLPEAPFNRACKLLGDAPPSAAVDAVVRFLDDPAQQIRQDAALVVGKTGHATIIPHIRKAFEDFDEYVRSYALMGLEFALDRNVLAQKCADELFLDVRQLLEAGKNADKAASILFRLNPDRAMQFFLSESVFVADSPIVHEILETLADAQIPIPRDRILTLIRALESGDLRHPQTYALREALRLLGQHKLPEDREFLEARITHSEECVAKGAAVGLLCSHGLQGFEQRIWDAEKESGYDSLSRHQRYYSAVLTCDAEINNGGLAQYFFNSSGNRWRDAVAGFEAMGSVERLRILQKVVSLFGAAGPSEDRRTRQNQLSALYKGSDAVFEDLQSRYYDSAELIETLGTRFVLAHPESFR